MRYLLFISILFLQSSIKNFAQCKYNETYIQKTTGIKYTIKAKLDNVKKKVDAHQTISWTNKSNVEVKELRFYMYLNSYRDTLSTFLRGTGGEIFGRKIGEIKKEDWASITASNIKVKGTEDVLQWKYIQPDDGNKNDASVMQVFLVNPIKPNETIEIEMDFIAKLPMFLVRAGYSRDEYYSFLHWFPQLGVYEPNENGQWHWNCHQFFRQTEFYADFSDFEVELDLPKELVVGYSGCLNSEDFDEKTNRKKISIEAKDVIDFAWIAYPYFVEYNSKWKGIDVKMLIPPEHSGMASRYLQAIENSLNFFEQKLGKYQYPSITLIDPPMHGLGSGFMEYPMLITCASFHIVPKGIRTIESLAVHEYSHQYFMAILASNEKEEAWLDEGFVTFFEDEIMDHYFGRKTSIWNFFGFKSGNKELSRLEYTSIAKKNVGPIAQPGWEIDGNYYKQLIYAKTATTLQTLKGIIGEDMFYTILRNYYQKFQFKHPKEKDFIQSVKEELGDELMIDFTVDEFFQQTLHTTHYCDYKIGEIKNIGNQKFEITVNKDGELYFPQEILIEYEDGNNQIINWDGKEKSKILLIESKSTIKSVVIDPEQKIYLDINFNNNSYIYKSENKPSVNYGLKAASWFQFLIQSISFLA